MRRDPSDYISSDGAAAGDGKQRRPYHEHAEADHICMNLKAAHPTQATSAVFSSAERNPEFPDEFLPGYNITGWFGILAPKNTDPVIIAWLNQKFDAALRNPVTMIRKWGTRPSNSLRKMHFLMS